ncbi:hypothetical protein AB6A40_003842 [Gnathostoma spinigerum]|uniref:Uncharacterized protein n=1 Tax=Gnathostoma spinigerum TaxID=75299 RepID=A0ABD6EAV9_9BILA
MGLSGTFVTGALGAGAVVLTAVTVPFVLPAFRRVCIPFVPATTQQIKNVLMALSKCNNLKSLVDLGSGDGRVVSLLHFYSFYIGDLAFRICKQVPMQGREM